MAKAKARSASRKAGKNTKPAPKGRQKDYYQEQRKKSGVSWQVQVAQNRQKTLDRVTEHYDRTQYLVAHEITPASIKEKPEEKYSLAWIVRNGKPVLDKFPYKTDRIKPIIVTIAWSATRKARKLSLYGGDTGQLGTVELETMDGSIRDRYMRVWFPDAESGFPGLSPATFTQWTHDGYYIDRRIRKPVPSLYRGKRIMRPTWVTESVWIPRSYARQSEYDWWLASEVQIDADIHGHNGREIKFIPETHPDIIEQEPRTPEISRDLDKVLAGKQTVMLWESWETPRLPGEVHGGGHRPPLTTCDLVPGPIVPPSRYGNISRRRWSARRPGRHR
jgi:hypothetical protein